MKIAVVGGTYFENCRTPEFQQFYGSGGRAAAALSGEADVELHTYVSDGATSDIKNLARRYRIKVCPTKARHTIRFEYDHGLSRPKIYPSVDAIKQHEPLIADNSVVLQFGMLEGSAQVRGDTVVYDPQSELTPIYFRATGGEARRLAIVANAAEITSLTGIRNLQRAAKAIVSKEQAQAVFVKLGPNGVLVGEGGAWKRIPAYFAEWINPIGSGDIFSAAVTLFWGKYRLPATAAADLASKCTADYVARRTLPLMPRRDIKKWSPSPVREVAGPIYLAGPFFDLQQRRLVEEVLDLLESPVLRVISPLHDIGRGTPDSVAKADLAALRKCNRVFAILEGCDPGTLFEVGYARALRIPVFGYAETMSTEQLTMFQGTDCQIFSDFVTAIYRTIWNH